MEVGYRNVRRVTNHFVHDGNKVLCKLFRTGEEADHSKNFFENGFFLLLKRSKVDSPEQRLMRKAATADSSRRPGKMGGATVSGDDSILPGPDATAVSFLNDTSVSASQTTTSAEKRRRRGTGR